MRDLHIFMWVAALSLCFGQFRSVAQCPSIPENVSYIKIFTGYHIFTPIAYPRHVFGQEGDKDAAIVTSPDDIATFVNVLDTLEVVDSLAFDVYDSGAKIRNTALQFVSFGNSKNNDLTEYKGYAIVHWRCKAPELIWFTPGKIERDDKRYNLPEGMQRWLIDLENNGAEAKKLKQYLTE